MKVVVDTAKGLELAECTRGNHTVEDDEVVQPLRPVVRIATAQDLRSAEMNKQREKEAFAICRKKIAEHGLDMKLVGVECSFEGSKTLFFFTSDGRVDFRELVKDLASVFHNRIELRQIGVRDEAKMVGGIGICGRPYCCNQFLEDFAPVSTKMAKTQSLSLNPAKISGSCGRLMCCLRYEEEAYEDLLKKVPKQGAFVETVDGYGNAVQVNVLRQKVKVSLDGEAEDNIHEYPAEQVAAVPGGRPADGAPYPHVLEYDPAEHEEPVQEEQDIWASPNLFAEEFSSSKTGETSEEKAEREEFRTNGEHRHSRSRRTGRNRPKQNREDRTNEEAAPSQEKKTDGKHNSGGQRPPRGKQPGTGKKSGAGRNTADEKKSESESRSEAGKKSGGEKKNIAEHTAERQPEMKKKPKQRPQNAPHREKAEASPAAPAKEGVPAADSAAAEKKKPYRGKRHYYNGYKKKKPETGGQKTE